MATFDRENKDNSSPEHNTQNQTISKKIFFITIIIGLILVSGVWIWKTVEIGKLNKGAEIKYQELQKHASTQLVQAHELHMKLLAKPFVWAVRTEMMQNNLSQVNLYMNEMVKEKNFQRIAVINDKGVIVSSTNKKDEGQPFSTIGENSDLEIETTDLKTEQDSVISMTSPIMGFNNRLGTLFIRYSIPKTVHPD